MEIPIVRSVIRTNFRFVEQNNKHDNPIDKSFIEFRLWTV